ncbi:MAG: hydroxymethylbilane synthase [Bacteroidales bacterium]|nr:hydroxymethylbilane synthase [Bacteroidales bacterium]
MDTNNIVIRIIARGSKLSKIQVEEFKKKFPEITFQTEYVSSYGDKNQKISLLNGEAPDDIFTRELDRAIIEGRADIAVHSAKDLPQHLDPQLCVVALYEAFDKTDSLVSIHNTKLADLPAGSKIGTSSPLRKKELLALRSDIEIVGIRGCIEDRVQQVRSGKIDAAIVATCALKRLGMENEIAEILPFETHPMQGRLAVTGRADNELIVKLFSRGSIL